MSSELAVEARGLGKRYALARQARATTLPERIAQLVRAPFGGDDETLYPTYRHLLARDPGLKVHLYGKGVRPGRKIGHVTVFGDDLEALRERAAHATGYLRGTIRE